MPIRSLGRTALAIALPLQAWLASTALAAEPSAAKVHFDQAMAHIDRAEYPQAIEQLWRAYELKPHHSVLYNLGQAYGLLDDPVQAVATYERYLEEGADAIASDRRDDVRKAIEAQRARIAEVVVQVSHAEAAVRIDGLGVGAAPLQQAVPIRAGRHLVSASLPGYDTAEQWIVLAGRQRTTVRLELAPVSVPSPPRTGQLLVDCALAAVEVRIDGTLVGSTPLGAALTVPTGSRAVGFGRPGYRFDLAAVVVEPDRAARVACKPELERPLDSAVAALLDVALPEGAVVAVDGSPGAAARQLPAGPHLVEVTRHGYVPWRTQVTLAPKETKRLHPKLIATKGYREDRETEREIQRTTALLLGGTGVALGVVTLGHFLWNDGRHDDWSSEDEALRGEWASTTSSNAALAARQRANDELLASILRADAATIGLGVGAGAFVTASVVLLLAGDYGDDYVLEPAVGSNELGVRCAGTW